MWREAKARLVANPLVANPLVVVDSEISVRLSHRLIDCMTGFCMHIVLHILPICDKLACSPLVTRTALQMYAFVFTTHAMSSDAMATLVMNEP